VTNGRAIGRILAVSLALTAAPAWADDSLLDGLGRATGLIAPPADPPDFVKASRPSGEPTAIPVFATPEEPNSKVKSPAELKAMDADLERASGGSEAGADRAARKGKPGRKAKRKSAAQP
jgi:hypothetical protein